MLYSFKKIDDAYEESRKYRGVANIAQFPPYVTFELTSKCNFNCIMCNSTYENRPKQDFDFGMFQKAVDEIACYGSLIRFIGFDEPLLYPHIKEAIEYVKSKNLLLHITTNASIISDDIARAIINSNVDSLIFSFQGLTNTEYCTMRNVDIKMHDKVLNNIKKIYKMRNGSVKPSLKLTTTITHRDNIDNINKFKATHLEYVDDVQITGFTHFVHVQKVFNRDAIFQELSIDAPVEKQECVSCSIPNYELVLRADGSAFSCSSATTEDMKIGSLTTDSISDIWKSEQANLVREKTNIGNLFFSSDCKFCPIRYEYEDIDNTLRF